MSLNSRIKVGKTVSWPLWPPRSHFIQVTLKDKMHLLSLSHKLDHVLVVHGLDGQKEKLLVLLEYHCMDRELHLLNLGIVGTLVLSSCL